MQHNPAIIARCSPSCPEPLRTAGCSWHRDPDVSFVQSVKGRKNPIPSWAFRRISKYKLSKLMYLPTESVSSVSPSPVSFSSPPVAFNYLSPWLCLRTGLGHFALLHDLTRIRSPKVASCNSVASAQKSLSFFRIMLIISHP